MLRSNLLLLLLLCTMVTSHQVPFYRKDYIYVEELDAFYKIHLDPKGNSWNDAFFACDQEDATLFYPKNANEWVILYNKTESTFAETNATDIFVGIHNEGLGEFITVDGKLSLAPPEQLINEHQLSGDALCVTMEIETGLLKIDHCTEGPNEKLRPFVCKKIKDITCPTIDSGYFYIKETGKCYKINDRLQTWREASHTCFMEGGLLVVIESKSEAQTIKQYLSNDNYFAGFRRITPDTDYYTLKGEKLYNSYEKWNGNYNGMCGMLYSNGDSLYTTTDNCDNRNKFLCEMKIKK